MPSSVPLDGFGVKVIEVVDEVTTLPRESSTLTVIAGEMAPATSLEGWTVNASLFAAPTVTLKGVVMAPVRVVALPPGCNRSRIC